MVEPQKNPPDGQKPPEFGAILPEKSGGNVNDFLAEFEKYQKNLDQEWEKTKESYQQKVNQIMEDYLNQKFVEKEKTSENKPEKTNSPQTHLENVSEVPFQQRMESLLSRVERELKTSGINRRTSLFDDIDPAIINVSSRSLKAKFKKTIAFLGAAGIILGAVYTSLIFPNQLAFRTALPYSHASGILAVKNKLYLTDWFRKALYVHEIKRGLPIISVENIPNNFITGLALSDKNLWTVDGFDNKIIRHSLTEDHQAIEKFPVPGPKPAGLFWDGADLWTADNQTKILYQLKVTDIESPFNQYQFPQINVTSFFLDRSKVWVLDGELREVHVFRLQNPLRNLGTFDLDPFLNGLAPTGITLFGKDLLVTTAKPPQLIKVSLDKLAKSISKPF